MKKYLYSFFLKHKSILIIYFIFSTYHLIFLLRIGLIDNRSLGSNIFLTNTSFIFSLFFPSALALLLFFKTNLKYALIYVLMFIYFIGTAIVFEYYNYFGLLFTWKSVLSSTEALSVKGEILNVIYKSLLLSLLFFFLSFIQFLKISKSVNFKSFRKLFYLSMSLVLISLSVSFFSGRNYFKSNSNDLKSWYLLSDPVGYGLNCGFINTYLSLYLIDGIRVIRENPKISSKNQRQILSIKKLTNKFNIIMIQVESFDKWVIDYKINGMEVTPFLNSLKKKSIYFENFYAQHSGGSSSDADAMALTSLIPKTYGSSLGKEAKHNLIYSLPEVLKEKNYTNYLFYSYRRKFFNKDLVSKLIGFDHYYGIEDYSLKTNDTFNKNVSDISMNNFRIPSNDKSFFKESLTKFFDSEKQPFLSYFITLESHIPYRHKIKKSTYDKLKLKPSSENDYLAIMYQVDNSIKFLFQSLEQMDLIKNSYIFIYSDHIAHSSSNHGQQLGENIPLFIYNPNLKPRVSSKIGSHTDIAPTVTDLLGLKRSPSWLGDSLLKEGAGKVIYNDLTFLSKTKDGKIERKFDINSYKFVSYSMYLLGVVQ